MDLEADADGLVPIDGECAGIGRPYAAPLGGEQRELELAGWKVAEGQIARDRYIHCPAGSIRLTSPDSKSILSVAITHDGDKQQSIAIDHECPLVAGRLRYREADNYKRGT